MTVACLLLALSGLGSTAGRPQPLSLYIERPPTDAETSDNYTAAKFEPKWGCYLGAYIDQDNTIERTFRDEVDRVHRFPEDFEALVKKAHATYFFYMGYGLPLASEWVNKLGLQGKIVHIALEPNLGLELVRDDKYLRKLAKSLADTNAKVFLRFASEMNGTWVGYSPDPELYKQKFELVAKVMHETAPNVAMVWCPYTSPSATIPNYYPGDQSVDWVGVNMYSVTCYDQDPARPAWMVDPTEMLDFVYRTYSARKPIMIAEYGATHFSAVEKEQKTDFAVRCLKSLYQALPRKYPRVKAIDYFNANNLQIHHARNNDYSLTTDDRVLSTYTRMTTSPYFLSVPADSALTLASVPMPAQDGQVVKGLARVSAWTMRRGEGSKVRFLIDGKPQWASPNNGDWEAVLDFGQFAPGNHVLEVEAYAGTKKYASKRVSVTIQN